MAKIKPIGLFGANESQNHDVYKDGDKIAPAHIDIEKLISKDAGNVLAVGSDGKLFVSDCLGKSDGGSSGSGSDGNSGGGSSSGGGNSGGSSGSGSAGGSSGGSGGGNGGGSPSGGGGVGCQPPDKCYAVPIRVTFGFQGHYEFREQAATVVGDPKIAYLAGVMLVRVTESEINGQSYSRTSDDESTFTERLENLGAATTTPLYGDNGFDYYKRINAEKLPPCEEKEIPNPGRPDGLWRVLTGNEKPPETMRETGSNGCAVCLTLQSTEELPKTGNEKQSYAGLYRKHQYACASDPYWQKPINIHYAEDSKEKS